MKKQHGDMRPAALTELLAAPINPKNTRRVVEFYAPISLFAEVDEKGGYHILGQPGTPGHFQVGLLSGQHWRPASNQRAYALESRQQRGGFLHYIHRSASGHTQVVAFVQHHPTYKKGKLHDIDTVLVTPLWDGAISAPYKARQTYLAVLLLPCPCDIYQSLQQTFDYHQQGC